MAASPSSSAPVSLWFPSARATRRPTASHRPLGQGRDLSCSQGQPTGNIRCGRASSSAPRGHLESGSVAGSIKRSQLRRRLVEPTCRPGALARRCRLSGESRLSRLGGCDWGVLGARRSLAVACGRLTSDQVGFAPTQPRERSEPGKITSRNRLSKSGKYRGPHPATAIPCREGEVGAETARVSSRRRRWQKKLLQKLTARRPAVVLQLVALAFRRVAGGSLQFPRFSALSLQPGTTSTLHGQSTHAPIPAPSRSIRKEADPNSGHPSRASLADKSPTRQQTWNNGGNSLTIGTRERASLFSWQLANRGVWQSGTVARR